MFEEGKENQIQASHYWYHQFFSYMELFVAFFRKFKLVTNSVLDTVFVIDMSINIADKQMVDGENNDDEKDNFVEKFAFIS